MKKLLLLIAIASFIATISNAKPIEGDSFQRSSSGVFDIQKNTASNIEMYNSNYGIWGFDANTKGGVAGLYWPRGSQNQYVFAGGFWFGAKKPFQGELSKLVLLSYNPNTGRSFFVPGRIEDGNKIDETKQNMYRVYYSTDFNEDGEPYDANDGPNWPLWLTDDSQKYQNGVLAHEYILEENNRNWNSYPYGPLMHSDEHIFSTYKSSDLEYFPGGEEENAALGFPIDIQVEESIYSWSEGDLKDVVVLSYTIKNQLDVELLDCWFAPVIDIDIALNTMSAKGALNDRVDYFVEDEELNLIYAWTETDQGELGHGFGYMGIAMLETPAVDSYNNLRTDKLVYDPSEQLGMVTYKDWNIQDDKYGNSERYDFMSSSTIDSDKGPGDKRILCATGPFNMAPENYEGSEIRVSLAISFAKPFKGGEADGTFEDITGLTEGKLDKTQSAKSSLIGKQELIKELYYSEIYTNVDMNLTNKSIQINPNPANNNITFNIPELVGISKIEIRDIQGNIVYSQAVSNPSTSYRINTDKFLNGIYYLSIISKEGTITQKFLINK